MPKRQRQSLTVPPGTNVCLDDFDAQVVDGALHISKEEQRSRLQARLDDPEKRWKFSKADLDERQLWGDYVAAYEEAITRCNTEYAPWHIVPSDRKWCRNLAVSRILRRTLETLDPQIPPCEDGLEGIVVE